MIADEIRMLRGAPDPKPSWWDEASEAFWGWLEIQDEETKQLDLGRQIESFAESQQAWAA